MKISWVFIVSIVCILLAIYFYFQAKDVFCREVLFYLDPGLKCGTLEW